MKVELSVFVKETIYVKDKMADFSRRIVRKVNGFIQQLKEIRHSSIVEWLCVSNKLCGAPNVVVNSQLMQPPMLVFFAAIGGFII